MNEFGLKFDHMNGPLPYRRLPVSLPMTVLGLFILMMVVWLQSGFSTLLHLLFLFSSYLTWGFLLPFIQGMVIGASFDWKNFMTSALKALLLISFHFMISNVIYYALQFAFITPFAPPSMTLLQQILGPSLLGRTVDFILFFGLLSWKERARELNDKALTLMKTQANLERVRLKSLQSQLNPHFLFNTLHTVTSLIGRDDDKAREMTIKISGLLRKVLESNKLDHHTLQQELDLVHDYLAIETERFGDRLTVDLRIDERLLGVVVPTFTLQPLIENAFKHGIGQVEGKAKLSVVIKEDQENSMMYLEVINDLSMEGSTPSNSTGIGLANLNERLDAFYRQKILFEAGESANSTYRVFFLIPLEP